MGIKSNNADESYFNFFAESGNLAGTDAGESVYTTAGPHTWVAPVGAAAYGISILCIGGGGGGRGIGGGGGGGALGYKNNYCLASGSFRQALSKYKKH